MKRSKRKKLLRNLTVGVMTSALTMTTCVPAYVYAATTSSTESQREKKNAELSMDAATEGMVLLQNNNNVLPIASKGNIALFGEGAYNTIKGGTGSGNVNQRYTVSVKDAIEKAGYNITSSNWLEKSEQLYNEGLEKYNEGTHSMWDSYSFPDNEITDSDISDASSADTAIYVVSRNSGEGNDRTATEGDGDYYLTDTEYANIKKMAESFKHSIVLLNVGGVIDTKFIKEIPELDSVLLMSQGGMEGGTAVVKILDGEVNPSGKLTDTWAEQYSDYPSSKTFGANDSDTNQEDYKDGIYVGYRYFDSFNKKPAYEFGYGLSYTSFDMKVASVEANEKKVTVKVNVKNTGKYSGKEVAQVYFSAPAGKLDKPYQELAGYGKTDLLAPGESQTLTITYDTSEMSSYSEEDAAYIMEKGNYIVRVGNSSRNTHAAAVLTLDSTVTTEQLSNQMKIDKNIDTLSDKGVTPYSYEGESEEIADAQKISLSSEALNLIDGDNKSKYDNEGVTTYVANSTSESNTTTSSSVKVNTGYAETKENVDVKKDATLYDVYKKNVSMEQFVAGLSDEELANIVEGIGWGGTTAPIVGAQANSVKGAAGETTSKYYETSGIPNTVLSDGPAGIRITQSYKGDDGQTYYQYATAWPIGSLLAQTWNPEVVEEVGDAIGKEMTEFGVTLWLAPGMNIHRNPLCGRNFEYYSEDPFITGTIGAAATKGVQSNPGIGVTIKHFAGNNQEANRSKVNDTIDERTLREIYLKGFEMTVKSAQPMAIMSSYNKINGKYSAANYDMLTDITRGEWKFGGLVMTDWGSKADPVESMHDGNDLIMPGGSQATLIKAVSDYAPVFGDDGYVTTKNSVEQWNDFTASTDGTVTVTTQVAAGVTFNDKAIDMVGEGIASITNESGDILDVTTGAAVSFDEPTNITYKGSYADNNTLLLGDLQKSAMRVLNIIMQSSQFAKMNGDKGVTAKSYEEQFDNLKNYLTLTKDNVTTGGSGADGTTTGGSGSDGDTTGGSGSSGTTTSGTGTTTSSSSSHHHSSSSSSSDSSSSSTGSSNSSSNDKAADAKSQWNKNADGTWSFINSNGEKAKGWVQYGNSWYHLDSSGIMQTGWIKDTNGLWYYLNSDGAMKTGWLKDNNGKWYYLDASGAMKTGWLRDTDGKWYYLYANGEMAVDTTVDGYTLDSTGAWIS